RRLRYLEEIHQALNIGGHQVISDFFAIKAAASMTPAVHDDHLMMRRQERNLISPISRVCEPAMQQHDGFALVFIPAINGMPDLDAIDRNQSAAFRFWKRRSGWQREPSRLIFRQ